jgi:hypothetical protein
MTEALRHPLDPDPTVSTKATAVLWLGIVAVVTGPLLGGVVPGTIALLLARGARADMIEARGYLTGVPRLRIGMRLAWLGIILAVTALVVASIVGLLKNAAAPVQQFQPGTD